MGCDVGHAIFRRYYFDSQMFIYHTKAIHGDTRFVLLRVDESDIHFALDGTRVLAQRAKLSQLEHGDRSPLAEDVPDHALRARRRGQRAGVGVIGAHLLRQKFVELNPHRTGLVADLLRKVREHRRQNLIGRGRAASQHHANHRVVV